MYLVVISYGEEETHFFNTLEAMLKYFNCKSINEIIKKETRYFSYCTIYKISEVYD